jgi:hypothetical protein
MADSGECVKTEKPKFSSDIHILGIGADGGERVSGGGGGTLSLSHMIQQNQWLVRPATCCIVSLYSIPAKVEGAAVTLADVATRLGASRVVSGAAAGGKFECRELSPPLIKLTIIRGARI